MLFVTMMLRPILYNRPMGFMIMKNLFLCHIFCGFKEMSAYICTYVDLVVFFHSHYDNPYTRMVRRPLCSGVFRNLTRRWADRPGDGLRAEVSQQGPGAEPLESIWGNAPEAKRFLQFKFNLEYVLR
jgi:hypothetical protein